MSDYLKVTFSKHSPKGGGYISWERLEQRLIESGELNEQDKLQKLTADKSGISYTTRKKRKNEE